MIFGKGYRLYSWVTVGSHAWYSLTTARGPAVPGTARRPRRLRVGCCPQPVLGPSADGVIRGAFAEHPHVFSPARQPVPDSRCRGRLA
jgi:hypothetical protein